MLGALTDAHACRHYTFAQDVKASRLVSIEHQLLMCLPFWLWRRPHVPLTGCTKKLHDDFVCLRICPCGGGISET